MSVLLVLPCALLAGAAPQAQVARARALVAQVQYAEAAKLLEAVAATGGTDYETTLEVYELWGLAAGALKQPDKARAAFLVLLSLKPDHALSGSWPPRVKTPYFEARSQVQQQGALTFSAAGSFTFRLERDPLKLAHTVRLHLKGASGWRAISRPAAAEVRFEPSGDAAHWVELVTRNEMVIAQLGTAAAPLVELAAPSPPQPPEPSALTPQPPPPAAVEPAAVQLEQPARRASLRPVGVALFAVGVVAAGSGAVFGYLSSSGRGRLLNPTLDEMGAVMGLTRAEAQDLSAAARTQAIVANCLLGAAALLAVVAVILLITG